MPKQRRTRDRAGAKAWLGVARIAICMTAACTTFDGEVAPRPAADAGQTSSLQGELDATVDAGDTASGKDAEGGADADAGNFGLPLLSLENAARACARSALCPRLFRSAITSIAVPIDGASFASCVDLLGSRLAPSSLQRDTERAILRCVATATTCAAAGECLPIEFVDPADSRCSYAADAGSNASVTCSSDGASVVRCSQGSTDSNLLHCASPFYAAGSRCLTGADGVDWCVLAPCAADAGLGCAGSVYNYCGSPDNLHGAIDCQASGRSCGVDPGTNQTGCLGDFAAHACDAAGSSCQGDRISICDGTALSFIDCAAEGGTCMSEPRPHCRRPSDTCTLQDEGIGACLGSLIALCVGGAPASFDCASAGLSCVPSTDKVPGRCGGPP